LALIFCLNVGGIVASRLVNRHRGSRASASNADDCPATRSDQVNVRSELTWQKFGSDVERQRDVIDEVREEAIFFAVSVDLRSLVIRE
jgi:hypothetical protein